jgi:hypothetical protein
MKHGFDRHIKRLVRWICFFLIPAVFSQTYVQIASFKGEHTWDRLGYWLSEAGDVNGDGYDDFFTGQNHFTFSGSQGQDYGCAYLILGRKSEDWKLNVNMSQANARFTGAKYDAAGWVIAGGGDVDNDGLDDFIIGAADGNSAHAGDMHAYLYFGRRKADWGNNVALRSYADVTFDSPELKDGFGGGIAMIGDVNGDGYDDFLISSKTSSEYNTYSGKVFLFLGRPRQEWPSKLTTASAACTFYSSEKFRQVGYAVAGLGDVNGDQVPDFVFGSKRIDRTDWSMGYEKAYVFFGRKSLNWARPFNVSGADVVLQGETSTSDATAFVDWAGDVNGDGLNDILFGGYSYDKMRGKVYLLLGRRQWGQTTYLLKTDADASWYGEVQGDRVGGWMRNTAGAGDVNGDGFGDILIGAPYNSQYASFAGKAYLVHGKATGWQLNVNLSQIATTFLGESADDYLGDAVCRAGDVNGDGSSDILISAPHHGDPILEAGKVYVYKGESQFFDIAGNVKFASGEPAPDVFLKIEEASSQHTTTDELGQYSIRCPARGGTCVPAEPAGFIADITANDAVLAARAFLGMMVLSPPESLAADVDGDGDADIMDAVWMCRFSVGLPAGGNPVGDWIFTPESRSYGALTSDLTGQDYECYIVGDVDASCIGVGKADAGAAEIHPAAIEQKSLRNHTILRVPLRSGGKIHAIDAVLETDADFLRCRDVRFSPASGIQVFWNEPLPGLIRLAAMNPAGFCNADLEIIFERTAGAGSPTQAIMRKFLVNGRSMSDRLEMQTSDPDTAPAISLNVQSYPNPFNASTVIRFSLPAGKPAGVRIYNSNGQILRSADFPEGCAGSRDWIWDGTDQGGHPVASGIYHCEVFADPDRKRIKLLLIR